MAATSQAGVAVIDDDDGVRDSFRFLLEIAGFQVDTYASARAYLEDRGSRPRCLILDQNMPCMTGLQLAARLRAAGCQVPVLLVTACPSDVLRARAAAVGVARVLPKPAPERDVIAFVTSC